MKTLNALNQLYCMFEEYKWLRKNLQEVSYDLWEIGLKNKHEMETEEGILLERKIDLEIKIYKLEQKILSTIDNAIENF